MTASRSTSVVFVILGFIFFGGAGLALYLLLSQLVDVLGSADPNIATAIVAASATVVVSVGSLIFSKQWEAQLGISRDLREKKVPVYELLINFMYRMILGGKIGRNPTEKEMLEFFADFTERITIWGSDDVLKAFSIYRRHAARELDTTNPMENIFLFEELLLAVRRDLGHKNKGLDKGDVLAVFLNDIDKYLPTKR